MRGKSFELVSILLGLIIPVFIILLVLFDLNKTYKKIIYFYSIHKENILISLFVLSVSIGLLIVQGVFSDLNEQFWLSFIPNLITDLIGIIIATFIINIILNKKHDRNVKNKAYKMIGKKYEQLMVHITKLYITALKREPFVSKNGLGDIVQVRTELEKVIDEINMLIDKNFFKDTIRVLIFHKDLNTSNVVDKFQEHSIQRIDYTEYFKQETSNLLDEFIRKYISVLPNDLREELFLLEELMNSNFLLNPKEIQPTVKPEAIKFDVNDFRDDYKRLGTTIYNLLNYFKEFS